jgi:hypothetical protein
MSLTLEKQSQLPLEAPLSRRRPLPPPVVDDQVPHFGAEPKPLRTLWEPEPLKTPLPYKNVYIGASGLILAGWVFRGLDVSHAPQWGGLLMLVGGLLGAGYCLKSLRRDWRSSRRR